MANDIGRAIALARQSVDDAKLPADWQAGAFAVLLDHLLRSPQAKGESPRQDTATGVGYERLGISRELLADLADIDTEAGTATLRIPSNKIETSKSAATRQIALLLVSLRLAAGLDQEAVDSQHVRSALEEYNRYDMANFSANVKKFEDEVISTKKGGRLSLRLRRQGWEHAQEAWRQVAGAQ